MSQRQDIPDGFNIYERLYLDRDGHPNCINHQQKGARETDLDSHIIHLRTRNFSEDDKLALHAAIQVVQHNGLVDRQWLEELLKKGDPNFSRQCCGPETSTVRKRTAARAPTSKTDNLWVLRPELYQALSINGERPLRFIKTLQRYPFQEVESLVQEAIQTRIDRGGRGVRKDLFLSRPDVEYIKGELGKEKNPSGQKRSPDSGLQKPRKKIRRKEPTATSDTTTPPEGSTILVHDYSNPAQEPQSQPTIISDDSESKSDEQEENALFFSLTDENLQSLMEDQSVDSETMFALLEFIQLVVDPAIAWCLNPDHIRASRWPDWTTILCPVRVEEHWIVVRITRQHWVIFDPQPRGEHREKRVSRAAKIYKQALGSDPQGSPKYSAPIIHESSNDSGVLAIMTIIYLVLGIPVDPELDVACCRRMLRSIISGSPLRNASHLATSDTRLDIAHRSARDVLKFPQELAAWTRELSSVASFALSMSQQKRVAIELETQWTRSCLGLINNMIEQSNKLSDVPSMVRNRLSQASRSLREESDCRMILGENITFLKSLAGALESAHRLGGVCGE